MLKATLLHCIAPGGFQTTERYHVAQILQWLENGKMVFSTYDNTKQRALSQQTYRQNLMQFRSQEGCSDVEPRVQKESCQKVQAADEAQQVVKVRRE